MPRPPPSSGRSMTTVNGPALPIAAGSPATLRTSTSNIPALGQDGYGTRGDRLDLLRRALELVVGQHGRALERELAVQVEPGAAAEVLVADLDRHRPRDPVGAQQDHVERMAALPPQPLLGVVRGPYVVRR